ncbi:MULTISPECIES: phosphatidylserine/phosphatidylglycerophosphate/cardiolipin synthase family protein [Comamonas]|jgi:cardiolipin synthase C|uniref:Phosphatidylserine/phosphatidylglycerophosphate/ cardiolipin synthase family protein n=1 Tax=Comamonas sediminis TaxID=1783360 RepID=A0ABV4B7Z9_9BURK|nr:MULTISPECIES: phospholipase D family protein [unclassified Comamonas]ULR87695.1 phospholipase D-like domain-containing protein [Comamonas sp. B21-038]
MPIALPTSTLSPSSSVPSSSWRKLRSGLVWVCTSFLLSACASKLPAQVDRPASSAQPPAASSPLVQISQQRQKAESKAGAGASGFEILAGAQAAYGARLALVQGAKYTLDVQYYAIHADASTARLLEGVVNAARRGVRVRVLLDDFHGTGRNAQVMRLAFEPNIEMRMFNPLPGDRDSPISRMWNAATDFQRAQQRMHNKLFLADNTMGIMGGRNLGDAYFDNDESSNFLDTDVLVVGQAVQDLSSSFDTYWNNERAYPVQSLISKQELEDMQKTLLARPSKGGDNDAADSPSTPAARAATGGALPSPPDGEPRPGGAISEEQRERAWDMQPMDLRSVPLVWAHSVVMADAPSKIPSVDSDGQTNPLSAAPGVLENKRLAQLRVLAETRNPGHSPSADSVVDGLVQLLGYAKKDLLIVSPYFVPGETMRQAFKDAVQRGVRVRILTNSLSSNDAPIAHIGYARHRENLLRDGVELYELVSDESDLRAAFGLGSGQNSFREGRRVMLHSKVLVLDGQLLVVGSMNLDQRSKLQNTEIAVLVRSRKLSAQAADMIEKGLESAAWHVVLKDGDLVWQAPQNSRLKDQTTEPDASLPLRLMLKIISPFTPDSLL